MTKEERFESLDYGLPDSLGYTENDSLEAIAQKQANNEKDYEKNYIKRQNILRTLNREGKVKEILSPIQYKVFQLTFEYNLSQNKVAQDLNISQPTVNEHLSTIAKKIQEILPITPPISGV